MNHFGEIDIKNYKKHLFSLETEKEMRSFYTSVAFCNRCGTCAQVCPTYLRTLEEPFSPRGRNQAIRLILEGKINVAKNKPLLKKIAYSCTLCGRCQKACAGKIPTAQHVLELRRLLKNRALPRTLFWLLKLRQLNPELFAKFLHTALTLRRFGFIKFLRFSGIANLLNSAWLHQADQLLPVYARTAWTELAQNLSALKSPNKKENFIYLPSLEASYFLPEIQSAVLKNYPNSVYWPNTPSGLFEYVYGDLRAARKQVKNLIVRHQQTGNGKLKLLTDSIDVYNFFQNAPSLFDTPHWQNKARVFAKYVHFSFPTSKRITLTGPVCLDDTAVLGTDNKPFEEAKIYLCKNVENFVQFTYYIGLPALGYDFIKGALQLNNISLEQVKQARIKTIVTLSGLSAMQWNYMFKKHGIAASAVHIVRLNG